MIKAIKGTRDILPPASAVWNYVEAVARQVFRTYNYQEIRTPILEETRLFARGVGEETDIVSKEMYTFDDHGTSVTLRPENTASVIRSYIEHRLDQRPGIQKLFYIGPMFRRERPQKGRYRQFFQIGAEAIGTDSPFIDAEVIEMVAEILTGAGLDGWQLLINSVGAPQSRAEFVALIRERLTPVREQLSADSQRRLDTNPLRILDSKAEQDQPFIAELPSIHDLLSPEDRDHFGTVRRCLDERQVPYRVEPRLVRGLDYYTRTTFEFTHGALGAQNAICGGGRYDGLAEALGSKVASPGIGFSIGEDRMVLAVEESQPDRLGPQLDVFLAPMGEAATHHCGVLARELRRTGLSAELSTDKKLKRALETADKLGARYALVVGDDELAAGEYALKDLKTGEQVRKRREELAASIAPPQA